MPLRFEAWTLPSTGTFEKRFDIPDVLPGASGTVELSTYADAAFAVPATFSKLDQLVSTTTGSLIKVFKSSDLIDEFEAARVSIPAGRPSTREISGPQRNGLLEGIGIAPKDYPNHKAGAMHWKWGAENILPDLNLDDLGSIKEEWEVVLLGERYQLDLSSATGGTFTLNPDAIGSTATIAFDAEAAAIKSALEALAGINEVSVAATDDQTEPPQAYWVVFEDPKDLTTDMTANFGGLSGSATLTKFNNGFNTGANPTFTITVDGQTTTALAWNASANTVEGTATVGTGLQGLSNINDVTVSGSGTFSDPWVISFHDPPDITTFTVTFAAGVHIATQTVAGALDPSPITKSQPVDAGANPDEDHGDYGIPEIEVNTTGPLDTGATWTLQVNADGRYAGTQIVLNVTPGQTYSSITVPVYPEVQGTYVLTIKDIYENTLKQTTPRDVLLTAGSYQDLTIPTFTVPDGVNQIVVRVAVTDPRASVYTSIFYVSWQTATFMEGEPEATFTQITRELLEAAQTRGVGTWVELDATDTADTAGTVLEELSYTVFVGDNANLVNAHLNQGSKDGYQWRLVPEADAQVITPAGTTTHVLQVFYVDADEIEDLTAISGGPSVLTGADVSEAQLVTRRHPYTALIGLGAGDLSVEDTDAAAEAAIGRVERIVDVDHLGTSTAVQAHLDAQFAEQVLNQKALSATVLESARQLPGVGYGAGSKIWWQFPGIHAKEARPVKRWSWTHGNVAQFQVQGSRVLSKDAAMAAAVDMFLRRPGRRRDDKPLPTPTQLADFSRETDHYAATIVVAPIDSTYTGARHFECDGIADDVQLVAAFAAIADGGEIVLMDGNYAISANILHDFVETANCGPVRIIGKGARLNFANGVQLTLRAPYLEFEGCEITRAGTSTNVVVTLSNETTITELGHVKASGNFFHDIANTQAALRCSGNESALVIGNTFSDITISNGGGVVRKVGTGGQGFMAVVGNGFENISLTGASGWLHTAEGSGVEGLFFGNVGESISVTDLAVGNAFAAHNVINGTHVAGNHGSLDHGGLAGLLDDDHTQYLLANGSRLATFLGISGLTGATSASRYVGATTSGAPVSGTFAIGDYVIARDGGIFVCTVAGSPGTWVAVGAAAATDADAIHDNVAGEISVVTEKVTPVNADLLLIEDSAAANAKKRIQIGNLPGGGSSPLTTKGDLWGFSTVDARVPIGTNGQVLTADSAQTLGLKWAAAGGGGSGDLVHRAVSATPISLNSASLITMGTFDVSGVVAGDAISMLLVGAWQQQVGFNNNIIIVPDFDSAFGIGGTGMPNAATNAVLRMVTVRAYLAVISTSVARMLVEVNYSTDTDALGTYQTGLTQGMTAATTTSDLTGTITSAITMRGTSAGDTQEFTPYLFEVRHLS